MTDEPMTPPPDTKDWTWVLSRACPECGFQAGFPAEQIGPDIAAAVDSWVAVLSRPSLTVRPAPTIWSPLEYACHVRDVFDIFHLRLGRMLAEVRPQFDNWDQDAAAVAGRYWAQEPSDVSASLVDRGSALASEYDRVRADQWDRQGVRSDGSTFTVRTLGEYCLHDVVHHLHDVGAIAR